MTRIQLRRDTSANWSVNNPVPSAGEPCFEIDTGKLKIGDGSTKYNDLAYQGGGSSGGGAEIDDTTTSTSKVWSSSKTSSEIQTVADEVTSTQSDLTDLKTTVNGNTSDILTLKNSVAGKQPKLTAGDNITIDETTNTISATGGSTPDNMVTTDTEQTISGKKTLTNDLNISQWTTGGDTVREAHIDLSNGNGNEFISASGTNKKFGLYCDSSDGIQIGTSNSTFTQGLNVTPTALTFTNSDGTTTDLLASGSGDVTAAGDNTFTGSNTFNKALTVYAGLNATGMIYSTNSIKTPIAKITSSLGLGSSTYNFPCIKGSETDGITIISYNASARGYKPVTIQASQLQVGEPSSLCDVVTKSADDNAYMANMAMPSSTYVDLTLGASGTTYTAPADGWVCFSKAGLNSTEAISLFNRSTISGTQLGTRAIGKTTLHVFVPASKGDEVSCVYDATGNTIYFKFVYASGTVPTE